MTQQFDDSKNSDERREIFARQLRDLEDEIRRFLVGEWDIMDGNTFPPHVFDAWQMRYRGLQQLLQKWFLLVIAQERSVDYTAINERMRTLLGGFLDLPQHFAFEGLDDHGKIVHDGNNGWSLAPSPLPQLSPKERFMILRRDGYQCRLCGARVRPGNNVTLQVDHITPRAKGGTNDQSNLWTLCAVCNRGKGTQDL